MVKTSSSFKFRPLVGDKDIAGQCGDAFTVNEHTTVEIVGYTNQGSSYLVRSVSNGGIYQYVYRPSKHE